MRGALLLPGLSLPDTEPDNETSGIGFVAEYDTWDNEFRVGFSL